MIAEMLSNTKLNPVVTELFFRGRKQKIPHAFVTKLYFAVPKNIMTKSCTLFCYENS